MNIINLGGLILNFVGTILIIFYIRTDHKEWIEGEEGQKSGEKWYGLYVKRPYWLRIGIISMAVGFVFNIVAEVVG